MSSEDSSEDLEGDSSEDLEGDSSEDDSSEYLEGDNEDIKSYLEEFLPPVLSSIVLSFKRKFLYLPRLINLDIYYSKVLPTKDGKLVCSYNKGVNVLRPNGEFIMNIPIENDYMLILEDGNLFTVSLEYRDYRLTVTSLETGKIITQHSKEKKFSCIWLYTVENTVLFKIITHHYIVDPYKNIWIKLDNEYTIRIFNIDLGYIFCYVNNFIIVSKDCKRKVVDTLGDVDYFITPRNGDTTLYYITKDEAWKLISYDIIMEKQVIIPLNLELKTCNSKSCNKSCIFIGNKLLIFTEEVLYLIDLSNNILIFQRQVGIAYNQVKLLDYDDYYAMLLFSGYREKDIYIAKMSMNNGKFRFSYNILAKYITDIDGEYIFHGNKRITILS